MYTWPNVLTLIRFIVAFVLLYIACTGLGVGGYTVETMRSVFWLFLAGSVSDYLDGKIARTWTSQRSRIGEIADPIADKLLAGAFIVYMMAAGFIANALIGLFIAIILVREILITVLRLWGGHDLLPVQYIGKVKTAFQFLAFLTYAAYPYIPDISEWLAPLLLFGAVALTLISQWTYVNQSWRKLSLG
jgi:CDP-diacylglycerol--glycerol-3-phosphate 3-phosphatidyltransferase